MPVKPKTTESARGAKTTRRSRPALGNDPFERGAAIRVPVGPAPEAAAVPLPASSSSLPDIAGRVEELDRRVDRKLEEIGAKLEAAPAAAAAADQGWELPEPLARLLPALLDRLRSLASLVQIFDGSPREPFDVDPALTAGVAPLLDFLFQSYWRVKCREIDLVPSHGPAMVVANHGGAAAWDALVLRQALARVHPLSRDLRPLLDEEACRAPLIGPTALRLGAVPATPENAVALLREGKLVGVFPEGSLGGRKPWSERYRLRRFGRGGFMKIALRTGAPIVPCAVVGSEEATFPAARPGWLAERLGMTAFRSLMRPLPLGPLALLPLPTRWVLHFGQPIETAGIGAAAADDPQIVERMTEEVRGQVQRLVDEELAKRLSVFL